MNQEENRFLYIYSIVYCLIGPGRALNYTHTHSDEQRLTFPDAFFLFRLKGWDLWSWAVANRNDIRSFTHKPLYLYTNAVHEGWEASKKVLFIIIGKH